MFLGGFVWAPEYRRWLSAGNSCFCVYLFTLTSMVQQSFVLYLQNDLIAASLSKEGICSCQPLNEREEEVWKMEIGWYKYNKSFAVACVPICAEDTLQRCTDIHGSLLKNSKWKTPKVFWIPIIWLTCGPVTTKINTRSIIFTLRSLPQGERTKLRKWSKPRS